MLQLILEQILEASPAPTISPDSLAPGTSPRPETAAAGGWRSAAECARSPARSRYQFARRAPQGPRDRVRIAGALPGKSQRVRVGPLRAGAVHARCSL